jgi:AhpD family alkylhydroperoxidase
MATAHELHDELVASGRKLRDAIPAVYSGYARLSSAAMGEGGELPAKVKELIALAIAVTRECDGCVAAHASGAANRDRASLAAGSVRMVAEPAGG